MAGSRRGVFVSYRRSDAADAAGRLADRLTDRFGERSVFVDVDSIEPGADFRAAIAVAIQRCAVVLVVIGPSWLRPVHGIRRVDENDDVVRMEVEEARRQGVAVIPVLVGGAAPPEVAELPPSIGWLADRHAVVLRHDTFRGDAARLLDHVDAARRQAGPPVGGQRPGAVASGDIARGVVNCLVLLNSATFVSAMVFTPPEGGPAAFAWMYSVPVIVVFAAVTVVAAGVGLLPAQRRRTRWPALGCGTWVLYLATAVAIAIWLT